MDKALNTLLDEALDLNYTSLGSQPLSKLNDEKLEKEIKEKFPWAKAIIIGPWHYNYYRFPQELRPAFDKSEIFQGRFIKGTQENLAGLALEACMSTCGLKYKALEHGDKRVLESLAVELGLGIIRKNSKFYTEEGSFCNLHAWVIDRDFHLDHEGQAQACPDHCSRCIRQCPVQALTKAYEKDFQLCQINQKEEKSHKALAYKLEPIHGKYLKACNLCLEICPYNQDRWEEEEDYLPFKASKTKATLNDKIKDIINHMES